MNQITLKYLGKEYSYPEWTAEGLADDRVVNLASYEYWVQGYVFCYNETKRFHFLITKEEFAKHLAKQEERLTKFLRNKGI